MNLISISFIVSLVPIFVLPMDPKYEERYEVNKNLTVINNYPELSNFEENNLLGDILFDLESDPVEEVNHSGIHFNEEDGAHETLFKEYVPKLSSDIADFDNKLNVVTEIADTWNNFAEPINDIEILPTQNSYDKFNFLTNLSVTKNEISKPKVSVGKHVIKQLDDKKDLKSNIYAIKNESTVKLYTADLNKDIIEQNATPNITNDGNDALAYYEYPKYPTDWTTNIADQVDLQGLLPDLHLRVDASVKSKDECNCNRVTGDVCSFSMQCQDSCRRVYNKLCRKQDCNTLKCTMQCKCSDKCNTYYVKKATKLSKKAKKLADVKVGVKAKNLQPNDKFGFKFNFNGGKSKKCKKCKKEPNNAKPDYSINENNDYDYRDKPPKKKPKPHKSNSGFDDYNIKPQKKKKKPSKNDYDYYYIPPKKKPKNPKSNSGFDDYNDKPPKKNNKPSKDDYDYYDLPPKKKPKPPKSNSDYDYYNDKPPKKNNKPSKNDHDYYDNGEHDNYPGKKHPKPRPSTDKFDKSKNGKFDIDINDYSIKELPSKIFPDDDYFDDFKPPEIPKGKKPKSPSSDYPSDYDNDSGGNSKFDPWGKRPKGKKPPKYPNDDYQNNDDYDFPKKLPKTRPKYPSWDKKEKKGIQAKDNIEVDDGFAKIPYVPWSINDDRHEKHKKYDKKPRPGKKGIGTKGSIFEINGQIIIKYKNGTSRQICKDSKSKGKINYPDDSDDYSVNPHSGPTNSGKKNKKDKPGSYENNDIGDFDNHDSSLDEATPRNDQKHSFPDQDHIADTKIQDHKIIDADHADDVKDYDGKSEGDVTESIANTADGDFKGGHDIKKDEDGSMDLTHGGADELPGEDGSIIGGDDSIHGELDAKPSGGDDGILGDDVIDGDEAVHEDDALQRDETIHGDDTINHDYNADKDINITKKLDFEEKHNDESSKKVKPHQGNFDEDDYDYTPPKRPPKKGSGSGKGKSNVKIHINNRGSGTVHSNININSKNRYKKGKKKYPSYDDFQKSKLKKKLRFDYFY